MAILKFQVPQGVTHQWTTKMGFATVNLYGREGDINCQRDRVAAICKNLRGQQPYTAHILQPPVTLDQSGWHRVTDSFAPDGLMTIGAEGGVLPGVGHILVIPTLDSHVLYVENRKSGRVGAARVKSESLTPQGGCCGPENVVQALLSRLVVHDPAHVRAYITGGGPKEMLPRISTSLEKWGVQGRQVGYDGLRGHEEGLGSKVAGRPEQNWVVIDQTRM